MGLFLPLFVVAAGQDLKETHGKANAQIPAMGYEKWYDFYTGKEGETTYGMSRANYFYASALKWSNDRAATKLSSALQAQIRTLRPLFVKLNETTLRIGRAFSGGGTMWTLIGSSQDVTLEETVQALVKGSKSKAPMVVSKVEREMDVLQKEISSHEETEWNKEFKRSDVLKWLDECRSLFRRVVAVAKKLNRSRSDHVLAFCLDCIEVARDKEPALVDSKR